jgi:uncharacterized membrane protein YesL
MQRAWLVLMDSFRLTFQKIGLLLTLNILWWLFTLLIVTWPPATAGLYYVARRLANPDESEQTTWRDFFVGFKLYWLKSWQLTAVNLVIGGVILFGFRFYLGLEDSLLGWVAAPIFYILLVWLGLQLYLFPLLIEQTDKLVRLIFRNAFVLLLGHVGLSVWLSLLLLSIILVASVLTGPVLLILISFLAIAQTLALQSILET